MKISNVIRNFVLGMLALFVSPYSFAWDVEDLKPLYIELLDFKNTPEFKRLGFAPASPYHDWLDRVEAFREDNKSDQQLFFDHGFVSGDLLMLGHEYQQSDGAETDHSLYMREKMDNAFNI